LYLDLLTESVLFGRYWSVFLGIYHNDTEGKLSQYFRYRRYKKVSIYSKMTSARHTTALATPKEVFVILAESGTYRSANIMILNKTPRPPPIKTQHDSNTRNECFCGLSRSLHMRRVLAGKILSFLTCMPSGDSKNEPHQGKKPSFFFQRGHAITWKHTSAASDAKIQSHNAMQRWRLCSASACVQPRKEKKKQQSKSAFSFPPEERCPSLSQGKMMARALLQGEGAFSAPQCAWDGKTQQSKRNGTIGAKERKKETTIKKCIFFSS